VKPCAVDYSMFKISIEAYVKKLPTAQVTMFTKVRVYGYNRCVTVSVSTRLSSKLHR